ncbi:DUF5655 domain-containing protein [Nonomuraea sp. NPDC050556]|uniref:DUF5655 domain-containing protein n=1 Tax=Nonomuraea sp. NPDC050556 TaxID=3364369 RepID=UPI003796583A
MTPEEFFQGHPFAIKVFKKVQTALESLGPVEVRTTKSQVAFRRGRGFAYLWRPGQYLRNPQAAVVLTIDLDHKVESSRFKEVTHSSGKRWIHHLEIQELGDIDDEVLGWLEESAEKATGS